MSTTVDQRVVEMRFDNRQFESNVSTTMSTLDKLKQSLNLSGATKGLENLNSASKHVNMSALGGAVETVQAKFSALEVMGVTALANITNSAVNAGKRIASALTIDPIKTGFQEYETQINAVQTILANTSSKGTTMDDVNKALDTLNEYADKTIYNFTEMTRNIGTFTAAGVDLDTSVSAIQGIANLAAVSGSTSQQASTAMYQLSQALANGKVNLQDWNSVVNAGMGGQVFQDALKRTATVMGTDVDALIKKYGSFRESLTKGEWLTTDVLTKTLEQFTMAAKEGSEEWEKYKKSLMDEGYTATQAEEILKMANTATDAATKVKTFTQLWDTIKESAQSGWTQTWEIIIGDFEEAKATLTKVSDTIGKIIGDSAKARNDLLQGWKDAGGRTIAIEGIKNAFEGIMAIIKPIKEAFREVFPPTTSDQLVKVTEGFKNLTEKFKAFATNADTIKNIKSIFKGLFSGLDIGLEVIKAVVGGVGDLLEHFTGAPGGILGAVGALGDWVSNLRDSIKEADVFSVIIDGIVKVLTSGIDCFKKVGTSIKNAFASEGYEGFAGFLKLLWDFIQKVGSSVGKAFASIGSAFTEAFGGSYFDNILNAGLFAGLMLGIKKVVDTLRNILDEGGSFLDNLKGILDDVRGAFEAYQNNLKAEVLKKIAVAIGILAAALFVIASIDPERLNQSLGAIAVLFADLMGALAIFQKIAPGLKGVFTGFAGLASVGSMVGIAAAVVILACALKILSTIDVDGMTRGLTGMAILMGELLAFMAVSKYIGKVKSTAGGLVILGGALLIMAQAVKVFGEINVDQLKQGLIAIGALLAELAIFSVVTGKAGHIMSTGVAMVALGAAMKIFASVMQDFAGMNWDQIAKGLGAMGGVLAELAIAMWAMPSGTALTGAGLIAVATAMKILASVMGDFGGMKWEEIAKGLVAMGGALLELAVGLHFMNGTITGSAALLVAAGALAIFAPVMKIFGGMSWTEIAKGLVILAGAFAIIGVAGAVLAPLVPTILGLAGAFALFGIASLGIGAGLVFIATGLTALAAAGTAGATAIVASLTIIVMGIADMIPQLIGKLGEAIIEFCKLIGDVAPQIADAVLKLILEVLQACETYAPQIVGALAGFLIGVLNSLADHLPDLIQVAMNVIGAFFHGLIDALSGLDTENLFKGIIAVGLISGLMIALNAVAGLVPGAMIGMLGVGAVIAELALVLAAIGALAQIPGISWLIEEGGSFLEIIGTAIGKFVGGIVGGIAQGFTSSLPQIGTDLSTFMTNVQPFIDGASGINEATVNGVGSLASAILAITAANVIDGIASWLTGGSSIADFGSKLGQLGTDMNTFVTNLGTFDDAKVKTVNCAGNALKALAQAADAIPNEGGWAGKIFGENGIAAFSAQLPLVATSLSMFANNLGTFDETKVNTVTCATNAIKSMAEAADAIPNSGGWAAKIFGDNSIATFSAQLPLLGANLNLFATSLGTFDESKVATITCAGNAIKALAEASSSIDGQPDWAKKIFGDNGLSAFGTELASLGTGLKSFVTNLGTFTEAQVATVNSAVKAVKALTGLADADLKGAKKHLEGFGSKLGTFASDISEFCSGMPAGGTIDSAVAGLRKIIDVVGDISASNSDVAKKFTEALKTMGSGGVKKFTDEFTSSVARTNIKKAAEELGNKVVEGLKSKEKSIESTSKDAAAKGVSGIKDKYQDFYDAGAYLAEGFAAGIDDTAYEAEAKAIAMAKAAKEAAEEALGIESPSKEFYAVGRFSGLGFVNALGDFASKSYSAGSEMANAAKTGLQDAISKVHEIINSDINSQPTIRPVVDLTDVQHGADAISGMFNTSTGTLSTIGAISANMRRRNQNGSAEEVVSAINKLRKDIAGMDRTSYNINGLSYSDNAELDAAFKTIVRHAKIERRV